jgi:AcrR family transcriptional regulator
MSKQVKAESKARLKEEIAEFKRKRILEEATHLFFRDGYEQTTLDAVASALDVTKPFIYSYFKNKGELLREICQTGISLSLAEMDVALQTEGSPADILKRVVDRVAKVVLEYQEYVVVYVREEKNLEAEDARAIRQLRNEFDHKLAELLKQGVASGDFETPDPLLTATTIGGMVSWLALWFKPEGTFTASEIILNTSQLTQRMLVIKK